MQRLKHIWKSTPLFAKIGFCAGIVTLAVHIIALLSSSFSYAVHQTAGAALRTIFAYVTCLFPFSVAEIFLIGLPLWLFAVIFFVVRSVKKHRNAKRITACFLAILPMLYASFLFTIGLGYLSPSLDRHLSLEKENAPSAQELYETALILSDGARALADAHGFSVSEEGSTLLPYTHREMNRHLIEAYGDCAERYDFLQNFRVGTKQILLSKPMAYTGITGVYSFFTGEANLNTAYPDFSTVYTAAHEMAHARGIAREDEANFVAFLACIQSSEAYIQYCGYTNLLQYVINALWQADKTLWKAAYSNVPPMVQREFYAYNEVVEKYNESPVRDVAQSVNDFYLESMGTEGTVSYGLVVDLAVAYYRIRE